MGGGGGVEETADQVQEQKNNVKLYKYYTESYKPYIEKNITRASENAASPVQANAAKAQANAEAMKAISSQPPVTNAVGATKQMNTAAAVSSDAQNKAAGKVRQMQTGTQQNYIDIGRGQQTSAQAGQSTIAAQSVKDAITDKQTELMGQGQAENAVGSAVGTAAAIYSRSLMKPTVAADGMTPGNSYGVTLANANPEIWAPQPLYAGG